MSVTLADIDMLKKGWLEDPCWDIEDTEGFEDFHEELLAFRLQQEERWKAIRHDELTEKASALGIPGNIKLARYIEKLETQIERLEERISRLESK